MSAGTPFSEPLLSIIVPNRNDQGKLAGLFESILSQPLKDLEVIVVDDCSDDRDFTIIDTYRKKLPDVRLIESRERLYTKNARLLGVEKARGKFITFADADDSFVGDDTLSANVNVMLRDSPDILHFPAILIDDAGNRLKAHTGPFTDRLTGPEIFKTFVEQWSAFSMCGKIYRKDFLLPLLDDARLFPIRHVYEDICLNLLFFFHAEKYMGSTAGAYGYNRHEKISSALCFSRAGALHVLLTELLPYFAAHQNRAEDLEKLAGILRQRITVWIGRFCLRCAAEGMTEREAAAFLLEQEKRLPALLEMLLIGNTTNTEKLVAISQILYPPKP